VSIGFQSKELVWIQIQEALLAEPTTAIEDELQAYSMLVPNGSNLVFTLLFEIDNPVVRERLLRHYAGAENSISLTLGSGRSIPCRAFDDDGVSRVSDDGKTSAVHFLEFPSLSLAEANKVKGPIQIACSHPNYQHSATISDATWHSLKQDLD
jgi:hypothetical protein